LTLFSHFISCSTSLAGTFGNTEYQHQHIGIPDTQLTWLILNCLSMPNERDPSTFYTLSRHVGHKLHCIEDLPKRWRNPMGGLSHVEQVWCHMQNMSQNISHLTHLIFEGFQTHPQKMKFITDTTQKC
jgi:hypothetical protein